MKVALSLLFGLVAVVQAQVNVLTYHNDNARTGQNPAETILTPGNVNPNQFGQLYRLKVDGAVYAQPLYVAGVSIPHVGTRNVLYIATEHDTVYAFDADRKGRPYWKRWLLDRHNGGQPVPSAAVDCDDLAPEIGITSTPVINLNSQTIYVVAKSQEKQAGVLQRLHALDLATGQDKFGGSGTIAASLPGTGEGSVNDAIPFDALRQHQRAALLLNNGVVYIASASHCDVGPYHGWLVGYASATLQLVSAYITTPAGGEGGIWMSGSGPATDAAGDLYCSTGNGTFNADTGGADYGDSVLRLTPAGNTLDVADSFTPFNQQDLQAQDLDLGAGGVLLLPAVGGPIPQLLVTGSKEGKLYLCACNHLGGFNPTNDSQIVQSLGGALAGGLFGTPAFWNGAIYLAAINDVPKAFSVTGGRLTTAATSAASVEFAFPGATPSISANGLTNGIAWFIQYQGPVDPAILRAYAATNLAVELYNSAANPHDTLGPGVKFAVPTVANGKVYVGGTKRVTVFGLRAPAANFPR